MKRRTWTTPERHALIKHFHNHIVGKSYPSVTEIQNVLFKEPDFAKRTPKKIRSQIQHQKKLFTAKKLSVSY